MLKNQPAVLTGPPVDDVTLRSKLQQVAFDYIKAHPISVPKAFFWNGISRLWDIRRPARALDEVPFEGRSKGTTEIGLGMYYLLAPLALLGLWLARRRRELWIPLGLAAFGASIVFTVDSGTRYRATFEPMIAILAVSAVAAIMRARSAGQPIFARPRDGS